MVSLMMSEKVLVPQKVVFCSSRSYQFGGDTVQSTTAPAYMASGLDPSANNRSMGKGKHDPPALNLRLLGKMWLHHHQISRYELEPPPCASFSGPPSE